MGGQGGHKKLFPNCITAFSFGADFDEYILYYDVPTYCTPMHTVQMFFHREMMIINLIYCQDFKGSLTENGLFGRSHCALDRGRVCQPSSDSAKPIAMLMPLDWLTPPFNPFFPVQFTSLVNDYSDPAAAACCCTYQVCFCSNSMWQ